MTDVRIELHQILGSAPGVLIFDEATRFSRADGFMSLGLSLCRRRVRRVIEVAGRACVPHTARVEKPSPGVQGALPP